MKFVVLINRFINYEIRTTDEIRTSYKLRVSFTFIGRI